MYILLAFIGSLLLYATSKYFPQHFTFFRSIIVANKKWSKMIAGVVLAASAMLTIRQFGWGTGLVIFCTTLIFAFSLLLIVLPLHNRLVYIIALVIILLLMIQNML